MTGVLLIREILAWKIFQQFSFRWRKAAHSIMFLNKLNKANALNGCSSGITCI